MHFVDATGSLSHRLPTLRRCAASSIAAAIVVRLAGRRPHATRRLATSARFRLEALVEREWLQAGHPFTSRCAKLAHASSDCKKEAPVFLLFLDCVWQVWQQYPASFEFNEDFLIRLFEHAYCSKFGTFLCDNMQERQRCQVTTKTVSLWSYVNTPDVLRAYLNPIYEPNASVLWPSIYPQSLALWTTMYVRCALDHGPTRRVWQEVASMKERNKELLAKARRLRRQIEALGKEVLETGLESADSLTQSENGGSYGES